jgi:hypothetical protein
MTGTLKIERTDDPSKGVYKVTIGGTTLYADYEEGKLNCYDGKYTRTLTVAEDFSRFQIAQLGLGYNTYDSYSAFPPLGAPELTEAELALVGTYDESWSYNGTIAAPTPSAMTIKASDEAAFGRLLVKFLNIDGYFSECYANISKDGTKLSIDSYNAYHGKYFSIQQPIDMTINADGSLTFSTATMQNWKTVANYVAVKVVEDVNEAIAHISAHSTKHSDAIITESAENAEVFMKSIDSAAVYVNASTRFTDGGEFGLGCEMGISTQKLHARGPMGLMELTTYKYIILGNGHIR